MGWTFMTVTIIQEKCDPKAADDKKLPNNAYLIQYEVEGKVVHDIAMAQKAVDIFDQYYDKYKKGFKWLKQAGGQLKPMESTSTTKEEEKETISTTTSTTTRLRYY